MKTSKIFAKDMSNKGQVSKTCKELLKFNNKNKNRSFCEKMTQSPDRHCTSEDICMFSDSVLSNCFWPYRLLCPWDFPGKNTGVGCHFLFQGIFPTQRSNPGLLILPHCRQIPTSWAIGEPQLFLIASSYLKLLYHLHNLQNFRHSSFRNRIELCLKFCDMIKIPVSINDRAL